VPNIRTAAPMTSAAPVDPYYEAQKQQALAELLASRATANDGRPPRTSQAALLNGLNDILARSASGKAADRAQVAKAGADRTISGQNAALIQAMMRKQGVQVEGLDAENPGFTTPGKLDPMANDLTQAVAGMDPMAVKSMLAKTMYERATAQPAASEFASGGDGMIYDKTTGNVTREPSTDSTDKWTVISKPLPNGMVQDYKFNSSTGDRIAQGRPYKPVDQTPNITIGGRSAKPVEVIDPKDPNKIIVIDAETNRVLGYKAKETPWGARANTRAFGMEGAGDAIAEAEKVLTYGDPTASGAGALVDTVFNFVGVNTDSATQATVLDQIGGTLTSKVPRFQGPQSDKDLAAYRDMAAKVGDRTVPVPQRLAALKSMKELLAMYEGTEVGFAADQGAAPAGGGPVKISSDEEYNALESGTEFIAPDGSTRKKP